MKHKMLKAGMLAGVFVALAIGVNYSISQAPAMPIFRVQEMLAALLLFSIGFAILTVAVLILFLLDWSLDRTLTWIGTCIARPGLQLRWGWVQIERFGRKRFYRVEQPWHADL